MRIDESSKNPRVCAIPRTIMPTALKGSVIPCQIPEKTPGTSADVSAAGCRAQPKRISRTRISITTIFFRLTLSSNGTERFLPRTSEPHCFREHHFSGSRTEKEWGPQPPYRSMLLAWLCQVGIRSFWTCDSLLSRDTALDNSATDSKLSCRLANRHRL